MTEKEHSTDHVGRNVRRFRESVHLTQAELAHEMGVSQQWVSSVESGEIPSLSRLLEIAEVLEVSPCRLTRAR